MGKDPLVSVISSIYNGEKWLDGFMESILKQTYPNLEIILVDDVSNDNTYQRLLEYAKEDSRITVLQMPYNSLTCARKLGFDHSHGKYISFVDVDDILELDMYETLVTNAEKSQAQVSIGSCLLFSDDKVLWTSLAGQGVVPDKKVVSNQIQVVAGIEAAHFYKGPLHGNTTIYNPLLWDKIFNRNLVEKCYHNYDFELIMGEDLAMCFNMLINAEKVVVTSKIVYDARANPNSTSHSSEYHNNLHSRHLYDYLTNVYQDLPKKVQATLATQRDWFIKYQLFNMNYGILERVRPLYPFHVHHGQKIVFYGNGMLGHKLRNVNAKEKHVQIVGIIDKNSNEPGVYGIDDVSKLDYDQILVTVFNDKYYADILADLTKAGADPSKIQFIEDQNWSDLDLDKILTAED